MGLFKDNTRCFVSCGDSISCGLKADAFRANFLSQCQQAGVADLMDSVVENAYQSHKRVRHSSLHHCCQILLSAVASTVLFSASCLSLFVYFYVRKQNASRVFAIVWASVCPSVCHTREIVSKRCKLGSRDLHCGLPQGV